MPLLNLNKTEKSGTHFERFNYPLSSNNIDKHLPRRSSNNLCCTTSKSKYFMNQTPINEASRRQYRNAICKSLPLFSLEGDRNSLQTFSSQHDSSGLFFSEPSQSEFRLVLSVFKNILILLLQRLTTFTFGRL